jgi:hypothetical protein
LPGFVEQEFRDFLTCGVLAHGFARLQCADCALERLVPFSCKGRGFCKCIVMAGGPPAVSGGARGRADWAGPPDPSGPGGVGMPRRAFMSSTLSSLDRAGRLPLPTRPYR